MINSMGDVKRRSYRMTIRRGDAPELICAAAHSLFSDKGYLATSIEDIAAEAGVARPTIFTAVGPKATILRLVIDQALAGDDAPVPIAQRPWWREAVDEPDPVRSIELHARNMCLINQRAWCRCCAPSRSLRPSTPKPPKSRFASNSNATTASTSSPSP